MKLGLSLLLLSVIIGSFALESETFASGQIEREFWVTIGQDAALQIEKTFGFKDNASEKHEF
ncbi:MAG: hypothetical protein AABY86_06460, partial [Bdellovibrionota bacterium]